VEVGLPVIRSREPSVVSAAERPSMSGVGTPAGLVDDDEDVFAVEALGRVGIRILGLEAPIVVPEVADLIAGRQRGTAEERLPGALVRGTDLAPQQMLDLAPGGGVEITRSWGGGVAT
jgi:hypothetical protein